MMKIEEQRLHELADLMSRAILEFRYLNSSDRQIKILMPDWLKTCFSSMLNPAYILPNGIVYATPNPTIEKLQTFRNIEVFPHFENKIVVYHINFAFYEKFNKPQIIDIY